MAVAIHTVYAFTVNGRWNIMDQYKVTRPLPSKFTRKDVQEWWDTLATQLPGKPFEYCELKFENPNKK